MALLVVSIVVLPFIFFLIFRYFNRRSVVDIKKQQIVGFFHPFCDSGGGGERVLWQCVQALQEQLPTARVVVYSGDNASSEAILRRAVERFNLPPFRKPVEFIFLSNRQWVEDKKYPRFTLLGQSLGSVVLAWEALRKLTPHIWFDSTGYAFTFPLASLVFGCRVGCYVHYPTISTDMLQRVREMRPAYNNSAAVTSSVTASRAKLLYYRLFAFLYGLSGHFAQVVMVNSTWTANHIRHIWKINESTKNRKFVIVYPPCDTTGLQSIPLRDLPSSQGGVSENSRQALVLSVGQFRPEKDHSLQLRAFALFRAKHPHATVRLLIVGGVRNEEDAARVEQLRQAAEQLGIQDSVEFKTNVPFAALKQYFSSATAGLHTMWNEHFGIGVVEFMASGVIPVAHNSGGPKSDIVITYNGTSTGYLATTPEEYCEALVDIFVTNANSSKGRSLLQQMRVNARARVQEFSDESFKAAFLKNFSSLL